MTALKNNLSKRGQFRDDLWKTIHSKLCIVYL